MFLIDNGAQTGGYKHHRDRKATKKIVQTVDSASGQGSSILELGPDKLGPSEHDSSTLELGPGELGPNAHGSSTLELGPGELGPNAHGSSILELGPGKLGPGGYDSSILELGQDDESLIPSDLFEQQNTGVAVVTIITTPVHSSSTDVTCNCHLPSEVREGRTHRHVLSVATVSGHDLNFEDATIIPSRAELQKAQLECDILKVVRGWVENKEKPKNVQSLKLPYELLSYWKRFDLIQLESGLLSMKWFGMKDKSTFRKLILIPQSHQELFMKLAHQTRLTAHPGADYTLEICRRNYYWPGMHKEVKLFVAACITCGRNKPPVAYSKAPLQHIFFHTFNECLQIDHIVPEKLGKSNRGYRYVLTIVDSYTNYVRAIPTRTQEAGETIRAIIKHWVLIFGMPLQIAADQAPGFRSKFFRTVLAAFDCKTSYGQPYTCRSTGRVERSNRRVNQALRVAIPQGKIRDWDLYLDLITHALNSLKQRHSGYSSNFLVFGRELNTPMSVMVQNQGEFERVPIKQNEYSEDAYKLYKSLKSINKKVRIHANVEYGYAKTYHDRNITGPYFEEKEECFILIQCPEHKFGPRWVGPFVIKKKISDHLYVIDVPGKGEKVYNISKLKKYVRNKYSPTTALKSSSETVTATQNNRKRTPMVPVAGNRRDKAPSSDSDSEGEVILRTNTPTGAGKTRLRRNNHVNPSTRDDDVIVSNSTVEQSRDHVETPDNTEELATPTSASPIQQPVIQVEALENLASGEGSPVTEVDTDTEVEQFLTPNVTSPVVQRNRYNLRPRNLCSSPDRLGKRVWNIIKDAGVRLKYN